MDRVKVGGVCLLLLIVAAALPTNVIAQAPQSGSHSEASAEVVSGSEPAISQELVSESSGRDVTISAERLAQRSGLKPLAPSGSTEGSKAETHEAPEPSPPAESQESPVMTTEEATTVEEPRAEEPQVQEAPAVTPPENLTTEVPDNATAQEAVPQNITESVAEESTSSEEEVGTDRIWREGISPEIYTWTPQSFSGFFYDLKNDVGTERLTVRLQRSSRSIDSGDLTYSTSAQETDFEFGDWGSYQVIGFMADKYFAGYKANDLFEKDMSLINDGQLRRVLIDSDEEQTITSGSVLPLEEGYELRIKQIDINGNKVYLALAKDGDEIDSKVISPDSLRSATYQYKVDIAGEDTPIVMAHISNVFQSTESALVTVDGLFQISDTYASVEEGDEYERMKVTSVSDLGVEMENENSLTLRKGSTVRIFGNVGFQVADADEIRFAPVVERTGTYEVRGTVIDPSKTEEFTWTPYNFEGFYYDIDDDVGTEMLTARISGGTRIEDQDLTYSTSPQPVKFEFASWGRYDVIGFMADKYFAGYNNETRFTDEASAINEGQLRKVLVDSDDSRTIASGSVLSLEEGYELRIKQVDLNGNKVYLSLAKDGDEVDSKVVTPSSDPEDRASNYMYKVDIGGEKDVPIIVAHIQSVFRSTEADLATVDGLFQVSDSPESVEEGEVHGRMKVESLGDDGIMMRNDGSISLGRGRTIEIMDNLRLDVADSAKRLLAPIATKTAEGEALTLSVPEAVVDRTVTISVRYGPRALSGVQISVNGTTIGTTDAQGSISYTPRSTGTFDVTAKKSGYNDARASLVVRTAQEASALAAARRANGTLAGQLSIRAPAEIAKGESFLITVVEGINQTPVEGAEILFDGESIGNTSSQGTITYSSSETGEHMLMAEKEGLNGSSRRITVTSPVRVTEMRLPERASAGQEVRISAVLQNTGTEEETRSVELLVNGTAVESRNVTLGPGENATLTFSYTPKDPGLHRFGLDGTRGQLNVEKAQGFNWLIALLLLLLIAIGVGYYLHTTGELDRIRNRLQGR
ncbi:MAG: S-layer protein domain-containing protein [Methanothrix sp.]|nr:S-layer protein domain-containing protein [Methanothrix sp.]